MSSSELGRRGATHLSALLDVHEVLRSKRAAAGSLLSEITSTLARATNARHVLIAAAYPDQRIARIEASCGLAADAQRRARYRFGEGIVGAVIERGHAITGEARVGRERFEGVWPEAERGRTLRYACVPVLSSRGATIGALGMDVALPSQAWIGDDLRLLSITAALIAEALCAVREQHEEIQDRERERARFVEPVQPARTHAGTRLIGSSAVHREMLDLARQVASSDGSVLLVGETGSGKQTLAREIHALSARAPFAFTASACGTLVGQGTLASMLEQARGLEDARTVGPAALRGTLFLHHVEELPLALQAELVRMLEAVRPQGAPRIIAATEHELLAAVREGRMREDLYYRLSASCIHVPALRARRTDIPALATHVLGRLARSSGRAEPSLAADALSALCAYEFPGNLRELESVLGRALLDSTGPLITRADLPVEVITPACSPARVLQARDETKLKAKVTSFERALIERALHEAEGDTARAAAALKTTPRTLRYRMQRG